MAKISKNVPPPASYNAKFKLVEQNKYSNIGFGIGEKMKPL